VQLGTSTAGRRTGQGGQALGGSAKEEVRRKGQKHAGRKRATGKK